MVKNVESMTEEELQEEFRTLASELSEIGTRRNEIANEMERRAESGKTKVKLRHLSKDEKAALLRELSNEQG